MSMPSADTVGGGTRGDVDATNINNGNDASKTPDPDINTVGIDHENGNAPIVNTSNKGKGVMKQLSNESRMLQKQSDGLNQAQRARGDPNDRPASVHGDAASASSSIPMRRQSQDTTLDARSSPAWSSRSNASEWHSMMGLERDLAQLTNDFRDGKMLAFGEDTDAIFGQISEIRTAQLRMATTHTEMARKIQNTLQEKSTVKSDDVDFDETFVALHSHDINNVLEQLYELKNTITRVNEPASKPSRTRVSSSTLDPSPTQAYDV